MKFLSVAFLVSCALVGCSGSPTEGTGASEQASVSDSASITRRDDGRFDVVCLDGTNEVVTKDELLADEVCGAGGSVTCVRRCNSRYSDGSCASWGEDYCGSHATCVQRCVSRYSDGSCASWG